MNTTTCQLDPEDRSRRLVSWGEGIRNKPKWCASDHAEINRINPTIRELLDTPGYLAWTRSRNRAFRSFEGPDRTARRAVTPSDDIEFVTWAEERALAGQQQGDWLIKDRLEFGAVSMLAAAPKGGKSTLVMALYAAIAKGTDFFGLPVRQVPILNIDPENRPRFRVERFDRASGFDDGEADRFYLRPRDIPDPLTVDYLERAIGAASERTGFEKGLVVIDTLRTAFIGDRHFNEKDAGSMGRLLGGLRKCAERSGWSLLILHHTAKKSLTFYGSVAIAGAIDYLWTMSVDERSKTSTLSIKGRGDVVEDMQFAYDIAAQRLELATRPVEAQDVEDRETRALLAHFASDEGTATTAGRFRELLEQGGWARSSKSFAESRVRRFSETGWLDRSGAGTRADPYRFWISERGREYLATCGDHEFAVNDDACDR